MIELPRALIYLLENDARVGALVGNRIRNEELPSGTEYPAIAMWLMLDSNWISLDGEQSMYAEPIWRIDCWALTVAEATRLRNAVMNCLQGFHGVVTIDGEELHISGITFEGGGAVVLNESSMQADLNGREMTFKIGYREDISQE